MILAAKLLHDLECAECFSFLIYEVGLIKFPVRLRMNEQYLSIGKALWRYNLGYYFFPSLSFPCIQVWINFLLFCSFMKSVFYRELHFSSCWLEWLFLPSVRNSADNRNNWNGAAASIPIFLRNNHEWFHFVYYLLLLHSLFLQPPTKGFSVISL